MSGTSSKLLEIEEDDSVILILIVIVIPILKVERILINIMFGVSPRLIVEYVLSLMVN